MAEKGKGFFDRLTGSLKLDDASQRVDFASGSDAQPKNDKGAQGQKPQEGEKTWLEETQEGQLTIDVYQTDAEIVIKSTVAGVIPEELEITITNDMVTIKGNRKKDEEVPESKYYYQECYWGPFSRSVILPVDVAADRADALLKNGILTIRLPKAEKEQVKKIKVKGTA